jgi:hypothetical protein
MPASQGAALYQLISYICIGFACIFLSGGMLQWLYRRQIILPLVLFIAGCGFAYGALSFMTDIHQSVYPLCRGMGGGISLCRGYGALHWEEAKAVSHAALRQDQRFVLAAIASGTGILALFGWIVAKWRQVTFTDD